VAVLECVFYHLSQCLADALPRANSRRRDISGVIEPFPLHIFEGMWRNLSACICLNARLVSCETIKQQKSSQTLGLRALLLLGATTCDYCKWCLHHTAHKVCKYLIYNISDAAAQKYVPLGVPHILRPSWTNMDNQKKKVAMDK